MRSQAISPTDPYRIPYEQGGYSYYTPTQLAGINNHRRAVMDFLSPGYRKIATQEFQKLLALGASGWLFDENCHHGPVKYSFAPDHGYTPPAWLWDAEFRDTLGAKVSADGPHRYSVFVTRAGKRAVVVVNQGREKSVTARVQLPNPGRLVVATPEQPDARPTSGTLEIPPRSAAVVMEQ
ncbi:MAG: hypothetical protein ABSB88_19385 [Bryobacteraceae bacterium]